MKIKRFLAGSMREAIRMVREEQGEDAVILSSKRVSGGVEVVSATDYDASLMHGAARRDAQQAAASAARDATAVASGATVEVPRQKPAATATVRRLPDLSVPVIPRDLPLPERPVPDLRFGIGADGTPVDAATAPPAVPAAGKISDMIMNMQAGRRASEASASSFAQTLRERSPQVGASTVPESAAPTSTSTAAAEPAPAPERAWLDALLERDSHARAHSDGGELATIRREIDGMRQLLQEQVSELLWRDLDARQPHRRDALRTLLNIGLDATLARKLMQDLPADANAERARFLPLGLLARQIRTADSELLNDGGIYALVGPTGVGKTTTIAKLAARFAAKHGTRDLALVTTDTYRIGAAEQLFTYGRLLGVPVHTATDASELRKVLAQLADRRLVLIDTAGLAPRDPRVGTLSAALSEAGAQRNVSIRRLLVLSATAQASDLADTVERFRSLDPQGLILTKLDEATRIGGALAVAIHQQLPVHYTCNGQRVPEDIQRAHANQLVLQAMRLARAAQPDDDYELAVRFGATHVIG